MPFTILQSARGPGSNHITMHQTLGAVCRMWTNPRPFSVWIATHTISPAAHWHQSPTSAGAQAHWCDPTDAVGAKSTTGAVCSVAIQSYIASKR